MTARGRALDDEAVRAGRRVGGQAGGKIGGRDDGQEPRPAQRRPRAEQRPRAATHREGPVGAGRALRAHRQRDTVPSGEPAQQLRQLRGVARADEDVVDAGEHRPQAGERDRQLDLAQVVDPDRAVVSLLGEVDLAEVGHHGELLQRHRRLQGEHRHDPVGPTRRATGRQEVGVEDPLGQRRHRERGQRPPDMAALVAVLQAPGVDDVQRRARDDSEVTCRETARASRQPEIATPMPPWMIVGRGRPVDSTIGLVVIAHVCIRAEPTPRQLHVRSGERIGDSARQ